MQPVCQTERALKFADMLIFFGFKMEDIQMLKRNRFFQWCVFAFPLLMFFKACTPVYIPNVSNTAFYDNSGDISASAFLGTSGFDGQLSYALSDHIYLHSGGSFFYDDSNRQEREDYIKHYYYEGALGYYTDFASKGKTTFHIGIGRGVTEAVSIFEFIDYNEIPITGKYLKYFFQSTMGLSTNIVDFGGCVRYNYVEFYRYTYREENYRTDVYNHFIEPAVFIRAGWKSFRYHAQISYILGLRNESPFNYDFLRFSVGFSFKYNLFGKNK